MRLIFETMPGLEAVAADEVEAMIGARPVTVAPGRVVAQVPAAGLVLGALARDLRCVERLGVLLLEAETDTLDDVVEAAAGVAPGRFLSTDRSFAVRGLRQGRHSFNSHAVAAAVGQGVIDRFERHGTRPPVDLETPDVILRAELFDRQLLLWVDAVGDQGLSARAYRRYTHMASMRPVVAQLLLRLAGWTPGARLDDVVLIDPFCGSATILIEAALVRPELPTGSLHGIERFSSHLQGAVENIAHAGQSERITVHQGLAERTDEVLAALPAERRRIVVTNPPFGRRVARPKQIDALYRQAATAWSRADVCRVVTVTERKRAMTTALEGAGFEIERLLPARYGAIPVTVFVAAR